MHPFRTCDEWSHVRERKRGLTRPSGDSHANSRTDISDLLEAFAYPPTHSLLAEQNETLIYIGQGPIRIESIAVCRTVVLSVCFSGHGTEVYSIGGAPTVSVGAAGGGAAAQANASSGYG